MNSNSRTIVCVDDDTDDLHLLRQAINEVGSDHRIIEASNGVEALEVLEQMKSRNDLPCLVVLDINMPRMDGKQTLTALKNDEILSTIPVVLLTTSSSAIDKIFSAMNNVELFTKPLKFDVLRQIATKFVGYCRA